MNSDLGRKEREVRRRIDESAEFVEDLRAARRKHEPGRRDMTFNKLLSSLDSRQRRRAEAASRSIIEEPVPKTPGSERASSLKEKLKRFDIYVKYEMLQIMDEVWGVRSGEDVKINVVYKDGYVRWMRRIYGTMDPINWEVLGVFYCSTTLGTRSTRFSSTFSQRVRSLSVPHPLSLHRVIPSNNLTNSK